MAEASKQTTSVVLGSLRLTPTIQVTIMKSRTSKRRICCNPEGLQKHICLHSVLKGCCLGVAGVEA